MKCDLQKAIRSIAIAAVYLGGTLSPSGQPVRGQETSEIDAGPVLTSDDVESNPRAQHLFEVFATKARSLAITPQDDDKAYEVMEPPLFRFATEGTVFGSVYAWKDAEHRLAAIGTIGVIPINNLDVQFVEMHLLRPKPIEPLTIEGTPPKVWQPDVSAMQLRPVDNALPVAASARLRMTHMRAIARRFSAEMSSDGQHNQLRLLPQPLYRYPDSTVTRDGALFAFVWDKGTDPEVVLRLEATDNSDGEVGWHYQPVRFTWREVKLQLDRAEVWHVDELLDRDSPQQKTPYITGLTEVVP